MTLHSPRPYLIRALIDWIVDNDWTPHLLIATDIDGVVVPPEHVRDDRIVLNVSARAVRAFACDDDTLSFDSRFGGSPFHVVVPVEAVVAAYARETGAGLAFHGTNVSGSFANPESGTLEPRTEATDSDRQEDPGGREAGSAPAGGRPGRRGRPKLTVID